MSASRMPAFNPSAAKPSARLQEVVDFPTPPLPEATATTCLTPGIPAALVVARAGAGLGTALLTIRTDRFCRPRGRAGNLRWSSLAAAAALRADRSSH